MAKARAYAGSVCEPACSDARCSAAMSSWQPRQSASARAAPWSDQAASSAARSAWKGPGSGGGRPQVARGAAIRASAAEAKRGTGGQGTSALEGAGRFRSPLAHDPTLRAARRDGRAARVQARAGSHRGAFADRDRERERACACAERRAGGPSGRATLADAAPGGQEPECAQGRAARGRDPGLRRLHARLRPGAGGRARLRLVVARGAARSVSRRHGVPCLHRRHHRARTLLRLADRGGVPAAQRVGDRAGPLEERVLGGARGGQGRGEPVLRAAGDSGARGA